MRGTFVASVAALALLASAGAVLAQGRDRGGPGGGPGGGGAIRGPSGGGVHSAPSARPRGEFRAPRAYRAERSHRVERRGRQVERRVHRSEGARRAEPRRRLDRDRQQRAQRELRRSTEAERKPERKAERERLSPRQRAAEERRGTASGERVERRFAERHNEIQQARARLGTQDRERLHRSFDVEKARIRKADFDRRVGKRVPRHIRLFRVPRAVFAFFPYYRDYSYFVLGDEICIVDPRTYVVVDVIEQDYWRGGPGRPQVAELRLSEAEIALVRDSIPPDFPEARVRLRLALGAEMPEDVALHEFPRIVLDRVPKLREYRFVVSGDQIVIVHPRDRAIALVIDRR